MTLPAQFIRDFLRAGFTVSNADEFRSRLTEARSWQVALSTLLRNGRRIGICIQREAPRHLSISALAARFGLGPNLARQLKQIP